MITFSRSALGDGGLPVQALFAVLLVAQLAVGCQAADQSPEPPNDEAESEDLEDASEAAGSDVAEPAADDGNAEPRASGSEDTARDGSPTPDPRLHDGRHPAYLREVDVAGRAITIDVVQFLTGQTAIVAYHDDVPDDPGGPPNDYYIVNLNPRLRTPPVAADVTVELVRLREDGDADLDPATWSELPSYLAVDAPGDERLSWNPYWLTVESGEVIAVLARQLEEDEDVRHRHP